MAVIAAASPVSIGLGLVLGQWWLLVLGSLVAGIAPVVLLSLMVGPARPMTNGYRDMNYIGGILTVFGFSPTEQDAAAREAKLKKQRSDE
jgi:hypothetical protein